MVGWWTGEAFADHDLAGVDLVVDGVLGIGGRPGLPDRLAALVAAAAAPTIPIVAVDLPSGVVADTGTGAGGVGPGDPDRHLRRLQALSPDRAGGEPVRASRAGRHRTRPEPDRAARWRPGTPTTSRRTGRCPGPTSDKYARGVVGVDTGSDAYPGAGVLSTLGAVYGGAGMVRFLGAEASAEIIGRELPNVVFGEGGCSPGWSAPVGVTGPTATR